MPKRFDENLTRSLTAVALLSTLFCRSGESNAQVAESFSNETPFSLSDAAQPASDLSIDKTNTDLRVVIPLAKGAIYQGAVGHDGKPEGQGTLTQPTGTILQGEWRDGKPYRLSGTAVYADGTREVGTWNYDVSKGDGKITWRDGRIYKGNWKFVEGVPDRPDGSGEMTWPDGRKYVGQFRGGKMNGVGKMTYPNGKVEDGSWQEDGFLGSTH
jgi:hypothetical protein